MSKEVNVLANFYFPNSRYFSDLADLEERIEESTSLVNYYTSRLKSLALMTEPNKMMPQDEDYSDPLYWVQKETDEILSELLDEKYWLSLYEVVRDNWDNFTHENGYLKSHHGDFKDYCAIEGDFYVNVDQSGLPIMYDEVENLDPITLKQIDNMINSKSYMEWAEKSALKDDVDKLRARINKASINA